MDPFVSLTGLTVEFGTNRALDAVSLDIASGEVHGLLGHNGSGKSTLIRALAGVYSPTAGELRVNGTEVSLPVTPETAASHGLAFVHQGLGLASTMSVLDNLAVGRYERSSVGAISWRRQRAAALQQLRRFGLEIDPERSVSELEPVEQAIVAISRAMSAVEHTSGPKLLVLDEPTVYLPRTQVETLFRSVRELTDAGDSVLFVSHRLDEVMRFTDRVTVLRGGRRVATQRTSDLSERDIVELIIGRRVEESPAPAVPATGRPSVIVSRLSGMHVQDVDFTVNAGEVLGLTGLAGSGFGEIPYLLYGARAGSGQLAFSADGRSEPLDLGEMNPTSALLNRLVLIPADRARQGVLLEASVKENITLPNLDQFVRSGFLRGRAESSHAARLVKEFDVRLPGIEAPISELSGGNQQKCVLAKWLNQKPRLVLMDEPTQGVDVGGRIDIWHRLRDVAATGAGVIVTSESSEEIAELCDRVLIFRDGRIVRELVGTEVDKHTIADATLAESAASV